MLILHPSFFCVNLDDQPVHDYPTAVANRKRQSIHRQSEIQMVRSAAYYRRVDRSFANRDNTSAQSTEEAEMLLHPDARLAGQRFEWSAKMSIGVDLVSV